MRARPKRLEPNVDVKVAFISPCGFGNLGDVAIQDTFIQGVREQLGTVEIVGITQNPADTEDRHHVRAVAMDALAYGLRRRTRPAGGPTTGGDGAGASGTLGRNVRRLKVGVKDVIHWGVAFREMRGTDTLVVSGGGQLDDHWGGPWRVPYALWKWSLVARILRKRVVVLSVGAGTTDSRVTRFFLRSALRRADYRSFRDERTAARVRSLGVSSQPRVVPDLAFGHDGRRTARSHAVTGRPPTVVISPIAFLDPVAWPAKDRQTYRSNLRRTAELIGLLLDRGYHVVLCTSDSPDVKSAEELVAAVGPGRGRLELADTRTPAEVLDAFARADVGIASRLHGLILANLAAAPAIALSYDWKVDEHMRTMGLERFTFPISSFEPEQVLAAVEEILAERDTLATAVAHRCETLAEAVRAQFHDVFAPSEPTTLGSVDGSQDEHHLAAAGSVE
jgi:polysaccharide pyruvyl transferase WcaK-like protein